MNAPKKLLFVLRQAPYGSTLAKDALDAILATSAYEQDLSIAFIDDGVFQLINNQQSELIDQKNIARILSALPLYDITQLFVCAASLAERGITLGAISEDITVLEPEALRTLLSQQDHLLSF
ncbi:tRNA 5-methylaminomethyl-2-thiouridine synthase TusC [gamma proteobacterium IMCC1989]|nr:tRNA 5-methylaminomethyl-2-thiouridine synthase TusC [gamma proteobacterium IMCC1989]